MIENQPNEITLIYHSDKPEDKKARAFVETMKGYTIKTLDLKRDRLTETQLVEIANKMGVAIEKLFDPTYKDRFKAHGTDDIYSASEADLLTILINEPMLINTPITINGKKAFLYASSNELLTKAMENDAVSTSILREKRIVF
jgi:arsenate reductase-like glutaredoxin family protein